MRGRGNVCFRAAVVTFIVLAGALALGMSAAQRSGQRKNVPTVAPARKVVRSGSNCSSAPFPAPPTSITPALAQIPLDICGEVSQTNFDQYSWLTFIALNWPANATSCAANTNASILDGTGPTVWESWLADTDIFVANGQQPAGWCAQSSALLGAREATLPKWVRDVSQRTGVRRVIRQQAKSSTAVLPDFPGINEAVGGTLADQNGRFVRYEVRVNHDEYNYIVKNNLWSLNGQASFTPPVNLPVSSPSAGTVGAIEIKAAWKVMGKGDDPSRFYTTQAIVFNDADDDPLPAGCTNPVTLGLVGLHIIHKIASQNGFVWSTFEHVDNVTRSFNNPNCPASTCPPNKQTSVTSYELNADCTAANPAVQVTRVTPIATNDPSAAALNVSYQALLKGSVWQNYQLVGTQWIDETTQIAPRSGLLANTVLETFIQPTSSCIGCHGQAKLPAQPGATTSTILSDSSFIFGNAQ